MKSTSIGSDAERQEPCEELLVDRVGVVGVEGCAVEELHEAAELVSLERGVRC